MQKYMKRYYQKYRRRSDMALFLVLGGILAAVGVFGAFRVEPVGLGAAVAAAGVLLAVLPQFAVFARCGFRGKDFVYRRAGLPRRIPAGEIGAAVLCIYDEYRRWKGFTPVTFAGQNGPLPLPALVLLRRREGVEEELDICDTRSNTCAVFRKDVIASAPLDFDLLRELYESDFAGSFYISEYIHELYKPGFEQLFGGDGRVVVYDRIPKAVKERLQK